MARRGGRVRLLVAGLALVLACRGEMVRGETRQRIELPFEGVIHIHRTQTEPRELSIHLLLIDLATPGLRFMLTPANGPEAPGETTVETTRQFVARTGAQIGVNVSFYKPAPQLPFVDNLFLMVAQGDCYSGFGNGPAINLGRDNRATLLTPAAGGAPDDCQPAQDVAPHVAFGGNERLIDGGRNVAAWGELHPRTAAGLTEDGRLMLAVVDGRQPGRSAGMTTPELAELMLEYGAVEAINLDGGGSTTLVFADPDPRLVNVPVGIDDTAGTERPVGGNLAIFVPYRDRAAEAERPMSEGDPRWYDGATTAPAERAR
ncbi:MAG: hypothetical protein BWZ08_01222 [candidate division BRC1 bacterium ADurb.BinA292]|nr:MAG: hypothetical protein BWZ08_01222 [candidate division BRC1 bacterium ADurb.BinA292]